MEPIYTAVIVEPRQHASLELVMKNFTEMLDDQWQFLVFHGNANATFVKDIVKRLPKKKITLVNLNVDNLHISEYNALFYDRAFYHMIPTEVFLTFQTDTFISEKYKHYINRFIQYDYVGAPWRNGNVGNGGLSLRRKSKMLETLAKGFHLRWSTEVPGDLWNEDAFFSEKTNSVIALNKPTFEEAKKFSIETVFSDEAFGVHKCWKWLNPQQTRIVLDFCPGLMNMINAFESHS